MRRGSALRGDANEDGANRLPVVRQWPRNPRSGDPDVGPARAPGAVGHSRRHLGVDGSDGGKQLLGHPQDSGLDRILIGDHPALEHA